MSRAMSIGQPPMPRIKHVVLEINGQNIKLTLGQLTALYSAIEEIVNPLVEPEKEEIVKPEKKDAPQEVTLLPGPIARDHMGQSLQQLREMAMAQTMGVAQTITPMTPRSGSGLTGWLGRNR